ncbi:RHS repeat-associated core domain-containing protein [Dyadobacter sp. 50-39]|uniref:RHS repeat-associated core domain-containing protein n=1 Tax=Dyadobacter sp. 50-39 TaxID=1895756 RepID=UPI000A6CFD69|nr:RHS repeat-associated core domain-containing protein [Dyadobacter sp. 50-39]
MTQIYLNPHRPIIRLLVCAFLLFQAVDGVAQMTLPESSNWAYSTGTFEVDEKGGANFSMPIMVAPGTNGLAPTFLSVSYNHRNGNGLLGRGFTLNGFSSISLTGLSRAHDEDWRTTRNAATGFTLDMANTRLAKDGKRLVMANPVNSQPLNAGYWKEDAQFVTEQFDGSRFRVGQWKNGRPVYILEETKDGLKKYYGLGTGVVYLPGTDTPVRYLLSMITDNYGNELTISYSKGPNANVIEFYPRQIKYTQNNANKVSSYAEVNFHYTSRPDIITEYFSGYKSVVNQRLSMIQVTGLAGVVRTYMFDYAQLLSTSLKTSLLKAIRESAPPDYQLKPIVFNWNEKKLQSLNPTLNTVLPSSVKDPVWADWNNDGLTDYARLEGEELYIYTNGGNNNYVVQPVIKEMKMKDFRIADFDGDTRIDLLGWDPASGQFTFWINKSDGKGVRFVAVSDVAAFRLTGLSKDHFKGRKQIYCKDVNEDGQADLEIFNQDANGNLLTQTGVCYLTAFRWGDAVKASFQVAYKYAETFPETVALYQDLDDNGLLETIFWNQKTGANWVVRKDSYVTKSDVSAQKNQYGIRLPGTKANLLPAAALTQTTNRQIYWNASLNDDNLPDVVILDNKARSLTYYINKGNYAYEPAVAVNLDNATEKFVDTQSKLIMADFTGDGVDDFLFTKPNASGQLVNRLYANSGPGSSMLMTNKVDNFLPSGTLRESGLNLDFGNFHPSATYGACFISPEPNKALRLVTFDMARIEEDKITSIALGNGMVITPKYAQLSGTFYNRLIANDTYGLNLKENEWWIAPLHSGLVVVSGYDIAASNVTRTVSYQYSVGTMDLIRGFQGFKAITSSGNHAGLNSRRYFNFPGSGVPQLIKFREESFGLNGSVISITAYVQKALQFGNSKAFSEWVGEKTFQELDINGRMKFMTRENVTCDYYLNLLRVEVDFGGGHKDITISEYANSVSQWTLGRVVKASLQRLAPDKPALNRVSTFEYNTQTGNLVKETSFANLSENLRKTKVYAYDKLGNIVSSTETAWNGTRMESRETKTTFDGTARFVSSVTNAKGHTERFAYDQRIGKITAKTDANGLVYKMTYDPLGRETGIVNPDGTWAKTFIVHYNSSMHPFAPAGTAYLIVQAFSNGMQKITCYNGWDWKLREIQTGFNGKNIFKDFSYDAGTGLLVRESLPYFQNGTPEWRTTRYDNQFQVSGVTNPDRSTEGWAYSDRSMTHTNAKGQRNVLFYNERRALVRKQNGLGQGITFDVDQDGNPLTITDPGGIASVKNRYDGRGLRISNTTPDRGTIQTSFNGFEETISEINAKGQTTQLTRDVLGREVERKTAEGVTKLVYDTGNKAIGKVSEVRQWNGAYFVYSYDNLGRAQKKRTQIDGREFNESVGYDNQGRVAGKTRSNGSGEKYQYSPQGYLTAVTGHDNKILWTTGGYDARGLQQSENLWEGRYKSSYEYDLNGLLTSSNSQISSSQATLQSFRFAYDPLGNLKTRTDLRINKTESFAFDEINRLTFSQVAGQASVTLSYDASSRISTKSDVGNYKYAPGTYKLTGVDLNDPDKCITAFQVSSTYWSFSRLKTAELDSIRTEYHYDWNNQLIKTQRLNKKTGVSVTTYHMGDYQEEVTNGKTSRQSTFVNILGKKKAAYVVIPGKSTGWNFYFHDHLGSITTVVNDKGGVSRLAYNAWGERRNADTWASVPKGRDTTTPFGFTGHIEADDFGLVFTGARLYDPSLGMFISPDEIIQDLTDVTALNSYSYCAFNPVSLVDPTGFSWLSKIFKKAVKVVVNIVKVVVPVVVGAVVTAIAAPLGPVVAGAVGNFAKTATAAVLNGSSVSDALKAGLKGGIAGGLSAGLAFGVGDLAEKAGSAWGTAAEYGTKVIGHGVSQGAVSYASGGQFAHGFMSGAFTAAASPLIDDIPNYSGRVAAAAMVGGTASSLGGGSFSNGAMTGAFVRMFNDEQHRSVVRYNGQKLTAYDGTGKIAASCIAISGRSGHDPLPNGRYYIDTPNLQDGSWFEIRSHVKVFLFGDMGTYRIPLHPLSGTDLGGRSGFFIHGGFNDQPGDTMYGTNGCISTAMCEDVKDFLKQPTSFGPHVLEVNIPKNQ